MTIEKKIQSGIDAIVRNQQFKTWIAGIKHLQEDDVVVLNNSFLFRDVSTLKSSKCLGFSITKNNKLKEYLVLDGIQTNVDFRHISHKQKGVTKIPLATAVAMEKKTIGKIIFILIGILEDKRKFERPIDSALIKRLIFDPMATAVTVSGDVVTIHQTMDEDSVWNEVSKHFTGNKDFANNEEQLRTRIGYAIDELEEISYSELRIPEKLKRGEITVTEKLIRMLDTQIAEYRKALLLCKGDAITDKNAFNDLLRISYNFSSDALTFLRLIFSICDLKPLILWGTIKEHYELSEAFKNLPWVRSKRKPSLQNYKRIIGSARNSAFHNLFPFQRSVNIMLPDRSLIEASIRTFSSFHKRKENKLSFQDKELIDVLIEFTRTNEHKITNRFWEKNLEVLVATREVFACTNDYLRSMYKEV